MYIIGWGILEVTINTQASLLEKKSNNHWIGLFQGTFSIGCLLGAVFGGITSTCHISSFMSFVYIMIFISPGAYVFQANLYSQEEEIRNYSVRESRAESSAMEYDLYPSTPSSKTTNQRLLDELSHLPSSYQQDKIITSNTNTNNNNISKVTFVTEKHNNNNNNNNNNSDYDTEFEVAPDSLPMHIEIPENDLYINQNMIYTDIEEPSSFCCGCISFELLTLCCVSIISAMADGK